jgi:carbon-monoxide dehydrogenase large subunit
MILPGPYVLPAYAWEAVAVRTHKPPLGAYRGVGMTMGAFVMERMLDLVADRLGLDPVDVRRRNLIPHAAYPYTSPSGQVYDSAAFHAAVRTMPSMMNSTRMGMAAMGADHPRLSAMGA